jgi:hypothetical protein
LYSRYWWGAGAEPELCVARRIHAQTIPTNIEPMGYCRDGLVNTDFSVDRTEAIGVSACASVRFDMFNLFNHAN